MQVRSSEREQAREFETAPLFLSSSVMTSGLCVVLNTIGEILPASQPLLIDVSFFLVSCFHCPEPWMVIVGGFGANTGLLKTLRRSRTWLRLASSRLSRGLLRDASRSCTWVLSSSGPGRARVYLDGEMPSPLANQSASHSLLPLHRCRRSFLGRSWRCKPSKIGCAQRCLTLSRPCQP